MCMYINVYIYFLYIYTHTYMYISIYLYITFFYIIILEFVGVHVLTNKTKVLLVATKLSYVAAHNDHRATLPNSQHYTANTPQTNTL